MLPGFPELLPDELLYSALARYGDHMRFRNPGVLANHVFGRRLVPAVWDLPGRLGQLASTIGRGVTAARLAEKHTLLPYYAWPVRAERRRVVFEAMVNETARRPRFLLGLVAAKVGQPKGLRFCRLCVASDRRVFGEPYWHRAHQLPGVTICPHHDTALILDREPAVPSSRYRYLPLRRSSLTVGPPPAPARHDLHLAVSGLSFAVLKGRAPDLDPVGYRATLAALGYVSSGGWLRHAPFFTALADVLDEKVVAACGCGNPREWGPELLRRTRRRASGGHPLHHILLQIALRQIGTHVPIRGPLLAVPASPGAVDQAELARRRARWLTVIAMHGGEGSKAMRRQEPAAYAWLYRHDRRWLAAHCPRRHGRQARPVRVDWATRDRELALAVEGVVAAEMEGIRRPTRLTVTRMATAIGAATMWRRNRAHLPRLTAALRVHSESRLAAAERRLKWVLSMATADSVGPPDWVAARMAGLRPDAAQVLLGKHAGPHKPGVV